MPRQNAVRVPRRERSGPITYDVYCSRVPDGQKADLIDGVIYMASPDNTDAGELFGWLYALLYDFCDYHDRRRPPSSPKSWPARRSNPRRRRSEEDPASCTDA